MHKEAIRRGLKVTPRSNVPQHWGKKNLRRDLKVYTGMQLRSGLKFYPENPVHQESISQPVQLTMENRINQRHTTLRFTTSSIICIMVSVKLLY
jgi:hypothetical protein